MMWWRRGLHRFRFWLKRWSSEKDREYHNHQFKSSIDQPFRFSYTGYITIRRFADLALPYLKNHRSIMDIGCGTGEITCELASRLPKIQFFGVDHSRTGIERARRHADYLELNNIAFTAGKAETFTPSKTVDLIIMFDAFHHLENPHAFIRRMSKFTSEFLLLEPQGDWKGSWKRTLDLDWVIREWDNIQSRLAYILGETELTSGTSGYFEVPEHESVEHRYSLQDFKHIFKGYGLDLRGTVSGLDVYPPGFRDSGPFREIMGEWIYGLYKIIDGYLYVNNIDIQAKHWLIHAKKGASHRIRKPSPLPRKKHITSSSLQGPYQADYIEYGDPSREKISPGIRFQMPVTVRNTGFISWDSSDPDRPVFMSYHWQQRSGKLHIYDGERTPFEKPVAPGEEVLINLNVKSPESPGRYILAVDLVCEGVTWFSRAGTTPLFIPARIHKL